MGYYSYNELYHHGIKGQKWGVRRFQNEDGSRTSAGLKRYKEWKNDRREKKREKEERINKRAKLIESHHIEWVNDSKKTWKKAAKLMENKGMSEVEAVAKVRHNQRVAKWRNAALIGLAYIGYQNVKNDIYENPQKYKKAIYNFKKAVRYGAENVSMSAAGRTTSAKVGEQVIKAFVED